MKIIIVYGTNSSSTRVASEAMQEVWSRAGNTVVLRSAHDVQPEELTAFDLVTFGSCTWELITPKRHFEGQLQQHFIEFKNRLAGRQFPGRRFAIFGLGDSSYTNFCIAANHLEALVKQIGGTQVGQTLRVDSFFFDQDANEKKIRAWAKGLLTAVSAK
ncbi:MAG: flavodoxin family protein [Candidatus Komeilibacteria bacterium]|nr:flavodoxin family protein [Candidatus Komeilibacteria bacterium]